MKDIISNLKNSDTGKTQLTIQLIFFKGTDQDCVTYTTSNNIEFMIYDNVDGATKELPELLLHRYQIGLETSMRRSDFILDCVYFLHFKYDEINPNHGRSYIDSPD